MKVVEAFDPELDGKQGWHCNQLLYYEIQGLLSLSCDIYLMLNSLYLPTIRKLTWFENGMNGFRPVESTVAVPPHTGRVGPRNGL